MQNVSIQKYGGFAGYVRDILKQKYTGLSILFASDDYRK